MEGSHYTSATTMGGQTTFRPPNKISKLDYKTVQILSAGMDSLVLALNVFWTDFSFFSLLTHVKKIASERKKQVPLPLKIGSEIYLVNVQVSGVNGYEWVIHNSEFRILIGNWTKIINRPSIMITFTSQVLWLKGFQKAITFILRLLRSNGASIVDVLISRLDLCVDGLFPTKKWDERLRRYHTAKSSHSGLFFNNNTLTGMQFGKGAIVARIYDKAHETKTISKKFWFFEDVWKITEIPDGHTIIRVEFQFRREAIKELGILKLGHLNRLSGNAWSYATRKWLKFQSRPGAQSHQRKTLPWWKKYQNGFSLKQSEKPLIRCKNPNPTEKQLFDQVLGLHSALNALHIETLEHPAQFDPTITNSIQLFERYVAKYHKNDVEFVGKVLDKRNQYQELNQKYLDAQKKRKELGFL